jgi:hypothetical protein
LNEVRLGRFTLRRSERFVIAPRIFVSDVPFLDEVLRVVIEELRRPADHVSGVGFGVHPPSPIGYGEASHRVGEVEFVLGSGEGDVEEAAGE